jgi:hypothetical protein
MDITVKKQLSSGAGREGGDPDAASPSSERPRNSSGSASVSASLLDLRQHVMAIHECLEGMCGQGLIDVEHMTPLRRLRQRGFRRNRG